MLDSLNKVLPKYDSYRVGLVLYKDYYDDFLTKTACDFTSELSSFSTALNSFSVFGGRDIPEAVYEGLDAALDLEWRTGSDIDRKLILIGDAPPHARPQGSITKASVMDAIKKQGVKLHPIILPHNRTY